MTNNNYLDLILAQKKEIQKLKNKKKQQASAVLEYLITEYTLFLESNNYTAAQIKQEIEIL